MEPQTSRAGLQDGTEIPASRATSEQAANDSMFVAAVNAAKTRAYRAAVTAGLSPTEREDLYQEILLDIYERKGQFDPARGAPGTFTGLVSTLRRCPGYADLRRQSGLCSGKRCDEVGIKKMSRA